MVPAASSISGRSALAGRHDLELTALAAAGDRRAFGELVRRHNAGVRGLLLRMGAEPATADDVAQDAFMTAFNRIGEFRGEGAFAGWVKRIAARAYLKRVRRRPLEAEAPEESAGGEHAAASRIDLDEALKTLAPAERLCVSLCYGAGLSHGEAAEHLQIPLGTVKSHVKRGLDKLRARLAPADEGRERAHV
ncbi:MAG: sigma-70 family RNA polymerase sigma factor [Pseudomonadota bacterium]|nr:sigma-70 family RNA polymerase sigma factor [Pseudomonadota bacterium]